MKCYVCDSKMDIVSHLQVFQMYPKTGTFKYREHYLCSSCLKHKSIRACGGCGTRFTGRVPEEQGWTNRCPICVWRNPPKKQIETSECVRCGSSTVTAFDKTTGMFTSGNVDVDGDSFCARCHGVYSRCGNCGDIVENRHRLKDKCLDCVGELHPILEWNYKGNHRRHHRLNGESKNTLIMGIELEFPLPDHISRDLVAHVVQENCNRNEMYVVHDGTVRQGFETVFKPMSYKYMKEESSIPAVFGTMDSEVPEWKDILSTHGNAGLHIHINRKQLTRMQILKMAGFCMYNTRFISFIGKRNYNSHCNPLPSGPVAGMVLRPGEQPRRRRYSAVNLINMRTVEFRFFRTPYEASELWEAIEFLTALKGFVNTCPLHTYNVCDFVEYVRKWKKRYPHLAQSLHNYTPTNEIPSPTAVGYVTANYRRAEMDGEVFPRRLRREARRGATMQQPTDAVFAQFITNPTTTTGLNPTTIDFETMEDEL